MRRLGSDTLISLDMELERTLRIIINENREATESKRKPIENLQEVGNEENVESRSEGSSHRSTLLMENSPSALRDYALPPASIPSIIRRPTIEANNFEIKSITLQVIQSIQFMGLLQQDPNVHISNFLEVCDTVKHNGVSDDATRLRLFPFSLKGKAKHWLNSKPVNSITTCADLVQKFLAKIFPPTKMTKMRIEINNFTQHDMETF